MCIWDVLEKTTDLKELVGGWSLSGWCSNFWVDSGWWR